MKPERATLLRRVVLCIAIAFASLSAIAAEDEKKASEINKAALSTGKDVAVSVLRTC